MLTSLKATHTKAIYPGVLPRSLDWHGDSPECIRNFLLFSVHLRNNPAHYARKSSKVFLLVLPWQGIVIAHKHFDAFLLVVCAGDIETDPGHNGQEKSKTKSTVDVPSALLSLQESQNAILQEMRFFLNIIIHNQPRSKQS